MRDFLGVDHLAGSLSTYWLCFLENMKYEKSYRLAFNAFENIP